jgi:hypothetical protein
MPEREVRNPDFLNRAALAIEQATRSYYATDPQSIARIGKIIAVEDAHRIASFFGLKEEEVIRASLKGIPEKFRQDYLDTIYDKGVLWGPQTQQIAEEFSLVSPTLRL